MQSSTSSTSSSSSSSSASPQCALQAGLLVRVCGDLGTRTSTNAPKLSVEVLQVPQTPPSQQPQEQEQQQGQQQEQKHHPQQVPQPSVRISLGSQRWDFEIGSAIPSSSSTSSTQDENSDSPNGSIYSHNNNCRVFNFLDPLPASLIRPASTSLAPTSTSSATASTSTLPSAVLSRGQWISSLVAAGFDPRKPTFYMIEGTLMSRPFLECIDHIPRKRSSDVSS